MARWRRETVRAEQAAADEVRVSVRRVPDAARAAMAYQPLSIYCDRCEDHPTLMVLKYGLAKAAGGQPEMTWAYEYMATGAVTVVPPETEPDGGKAVSDDVIGSGEDARLALLGSPAPTPVNEDTLRGVRPGGGTGADELLRAREREDGAVEVLIRCPVCEAKAPAITLGDKSHMGEALRCAAAAARKRKLVPMLPLSVLARAASGAIGGPKGRQVTSRGMWTSSARPLIKALVQETRARRDTPNTN